MVVKVVDRNSDESSLFEFQDLVRRTESASARVAVDCEGVNLGRYGTLEIVSVCFDLQTNDTFLVDFQDGSSSDEAKEAMKRLLESSEVVKVIHDCRMDCDALYHIHRIKMCNVHDTSVYHRFITGNEDVSLNDTLRDNGLNVNGARDKNVYQANYRFWASRPLNQTMKTWASSDVASLLQLASLQAEHISTDKAKADSMSSEYSRVLVESKVDEVTCEIPVGRFIGRGGSNIRSVQKRTSTVIYQKVPSKDVFWVYHKNTKALRDVKAKMGGDAYYY